MTDNPLARLEGATQALAEARDLGEITKIRDIAEAARHYAKAARLGVEAQNHAAAIKLRAERRAGEFLSQMEKNTGALLRGSTLEPRDDRPTLNDLGIAKTTAHRWQTIATLPEEDFDQVIEQTVDAGKELTTAAVLSVAKEHVRQMRRDDLKQRAAAVKESPTYTHQLEVGAVKDIDLPPGSIDMIFTDPPYHDEYLLHYAELAQIAEYVLKPGGILMVYAGKMYLPEILPVFSGLEYVWQFVVWQPGNQSKISKWNLFETYRPILAFRQPGAQVIKMPWIPDGLQGTREKDFHAWQQGREAALKYIEAYTGPGDTVLDPFLGGGTTLVACHALGRVCIGYDIDAEAVDLSRLRLLEEQGETGL